MPATPDAALTGVTDDALPPFRFRLRTRVEIADTDLGAVVYYARYPHYLDRGVVAYRRHLGIPPLGPDGHLFVVRRLEVEYLHSARFDDELDVRVRTAEMGRSSHVMECRIERAADGRPLATARQVVVGVSGYEDGRPSRAPAGMVAAIRAHEGMAAA
jgi:acyl-CoA thioester hydrolase